VRGGASCVQFTVNSDPADPYFNALLWDLPVTAD
jgi:hypothetical protein